MVTCGSSRNDYRNLLKVRIFIFSLGSSSLKIDADSIPSVHNKRKLISRPDSVPSAFLFQVSIISLIETESHGSFHIDRGSSPSSSAPPRCPPPPAMQPGELIAAAGAPAFSAIEPGGQMHLRNHVSAIARPIRMTLLLQLAATWVLLVQFLCCAAHSQHSFPRAACYVHNTDVLTVLPGRPGLHLASLCTVVCDSLPVCCHPLLRGRTMLIKTGGMGWIRMAGGGRVDLGSFAETAEAKTSAFLIQVQ